MDPPHLSHAGKLPFQTNFPVFPSHLAVLFAQMLGSDNIQQQERLRAC